MRDRNMFLFLNTVFRCAHGVFIGVQVSVGGVK